MPLRGSKSDDDDETRSSENVDGDEAATNESSSVSLKQTVDKAWQTVLEKLPQPLVTFLQTIVGKLVALRWQFVSFAAGAVLTVAAIIVPIYSQVETLSKPVTLFETILGDLEQAYVDPVDTDKLFETGMSAMLRYVGRYKHTRLP